MIFGSSVEIRTSHSFHAEGPSHCPMMSNEQRETHADVIIQYTTPKGAYTPMARSLWSTYATLRGVVDKTSHGHLPLPCPRHHLKVARFLSVKNKAYDKRLFWIAIPSPCPATAHPRARMPKSELDIQTSVPSRTQAWQALPPWFPRKWGTETIRKW